MASQNSLRIVADDFGLHADINRGIVECIQAGVVRHISVSALGAAVDWNQLKELQAAGIGVGIHLTLSGEVWLSDGRRIHDWKGLVRRIALEGRRFTREAREELARQFGAFQAAGIRPDHADGHQHEHLMPGIWPVCLELAAENGVSRIRTPYSPALSLARRCPAGYVLHFMARMRAAGRGASTPCLGIAHSGHYTVQQFQCELQAAQGRYVELVTHPGITTPSVLERYGYWAYRWTDERNALLDPRFTETIAACGFQLESVRR